MGGIHAGSAFGGYRDMVTELVEAGEPFGNVEEAIDEAADLTTDEKAALWLIAFSLHDRDKAQRVPLKPSREQRAGPLLHPL